MYLSISNFLFKNKPFSFYFFYFVAYSCPHFSWRDKEVFIFNVSITRNNMYTYVRCLWKHKNSVLIIVRPVFYLFYYILVKCVGLEFLLWQRLWLLPGSTLIFYWLSKLTKVYPASQHKVHLKRSLVFNNHVQAILPTKHDCFAGLIC